MSLQKHARSFNLLKPYSFKHKYHFLYDSFFYLFFESSKASVELENNHLPGIRKEIEEDHERKKDELEAMRKSY
ncbi:hypothetical protein Hdeb2414_s0006g00200641 [Helianthus debilis subsp. tardiflorus]